jgi:hypothetical protein
LAVLQRASYLGRQQRKLSAVPAFSHLVENNVRECYAEDAHCRKLVDYCPELWFRRWSSAPAPTVGGKASCSTSGSSRST